MHQDLHVIFSTTAQATVNSFLQNPPPSFPHSGYGNPVGNMSPNQTEGQFKGREQNQTLGTMASQARLFSKMFYPYC
jgi:hypothetical protein